MKASREADRVANEAAMNLLKAQLAQAQSSQGSYSSNRGYGPWTIDATSMHVPPYSSQQRQHYQQWRNPPGGNPGGQKYHYGPAGGFSAGTMQQTSFGSLGGQLQGPNFPRPDGSSSSGTTQQHQGLNKDKQPEFSQPQPQPSIPRTDAQQ